MGAKVLRRVKEILAPDWDILLVGKKENWNGSNLLENRECLSMPQQFSPNTWGRFAALDGSVSRRSIFPSQEEDYTDAEDTHSIPHTFQKVWAVIPGKEWLLWCQFHCQLVELLTTFWMGTSWRGKQGLGSWLGKFLDLRHSEMIFCTLDLLHFLFFLSP